MSAIHPLFQRILDTAPHAPPVICRRCDDVIDVADHTLEACEDTRQQAAIAADLAYNREKAHRANNEAFVRSMQLQMQQADCGLTS